MYTSIYGRGRAVHHLKRGGGELLLSNGLGSSNMEGVSSGPIIQGMGVSTKSDRLDSQQKVPMQNVMDKLQNLQLRTTGKRKNISFVI